LGSPARSPGTTFVTPQPEPDFTAWGPSRQPPFRFGATITLFCLPLSLGPQAACTASPEVSLHRQPSASRKLLFQPLTDSDTMKPVASALALTLAALPMLAFAGAKCPTHPKNEWMKPEEARAKLESEGYKIKKFKVDRECYEIYGRNKEGKKVEIYFDTKTLDIVKAEIDD
jgi:hypothetical protein